MQLSAEHEAQLCAGLSNTERRQLITLLSRVAAEQGLPTGVHPGSPGYQRRRQALTQGAPPGGKNRVTMRHP